MGSGSPLSDTHGSLTNTHITQGVISSSLSWFSMNIPRLSPPASWAVTAVILMTLLTYPTKTPRSPATVPQPWACCWQGDGPKGEFFRLGSNIQSCTAFNEDRTRKTVTVLHTQYNEMQMILKTSRIQAPPPLLLSSLYYPANEWQSEGICQFELNTIGVWSFQ